MQEKWIRWEPAKKLAPKYYIESITDRVEDKFNMVLSDSETKKKVLVSFPHGVDAYRSTDESFILLTINTLDETYGTNFYGDWTFFKVEDSEYLKWISSQTYNIYDKSKFPFIHFCILGIDSMVDIITTYEPTITFLD